MSPNATSVKAIIKAHRPKFKSRGAKLAFAVHAFFLAEGWKLVAAGKRADEAAPEEELTQEVEVNGWNEMGDAFAFRYLPENGRKEGALQVQMQAVGDTLLLHWQTVTSAEAPQTLELPIPEYVAQASGLEDPQGYTKLQELLDLLDSGLAPAKQAAGSTAGHEQQPAAAAQAQAQRRGGVGEDAEMHEGGRLPLPLPEAERDFDDFRPESMARGRGPPLSAPGASDLVPPGLRAPGTSGGFGIPHLQPGGPGLGPFTGGGMHMGPSSNPLDASRLRVPGRGRGPHLPPGARYDPIGPRGLPGWNPDDFQRGGPGNPGEGGRTHPDIQQPGAGRGGVDFDSMFG